MRIRTAKDVEKLDATIKEELGIDVQEYRNEEVIENFFELLIFPRYVLVWTIRPIIISIIAFLLGFLLFDLVGLDYIIYIVVGVFLFPITGVLIGLFFLTWKMKSDLWSIIAYSLEIMQSAVQDIDQVNSSITKENRKEVLSLLFLGIIHIVTIPMLSKVISDQVPIVGGLLNGIVKRVLTLVSDRFSFDEEVLDQEIEEKDGPSTTLQHLSNGISSASQGLEKVLDYTFGIAQLPIKLVLFFVLILLITFIYLIN